MASTPISRSVLILASGGLDSSCLIAEALSRKCEIVLLYFRYGQTVAERELAFLRKCVSVYGLENLIVRDIDFGFVDDLMLTGSYPEEATLSNDNREIPPEWVPLRNVIFVSLACAFAIVHNIPEVWLGSSKEDFFADNCATFGHLYNQMLDYASYGKVKLVQPIVELTKSEAIRRYHRDFILCDSWSCYRSQPHHCGRCNGCLERMNAFRTAQVDDSTRYENARLE